MKLLRFKLVTTRGCYHWLYQLLWFLGWHGGLPRSKSIPGNFEDWLATEFTFCRNSPAGSRWSHCWYPIWSKESMTKNQVHLCFHRFKFGSIYESMIIYDSMFLDLCSLIQPKSVPPCSTPSPIAGPAASRTWPGLVIAPRWPKELRMLMITVKHDSVSHCSYSYRIRNHIIKKSISTVNWWSLS